MGKHLDQLRLDSQDTRVGSLTKLTKGASVGFVSAWGVGSPAEKTSGSAIQAAIVGARSWQDLSRLCEDIDAAYRADNIDAEAADELTNLVRQRSRAVPENDAALLEMLLSSSLSQGSAVRSTPKSSMPRCRLTRRWRFTGPVNYGCSNGPFLRWSGPYTR